MQIESILFARLNKKPSITWTSPQVGIGKCEQSAVCRKSQPGPLEGAIDTNGPYVTISTRLPLRPWNK